MVTDVILLLVVVLQLTSVIMLLVMNIKRIKEEKEFSKHLQEIYIQIEEEMKTQLTELEKGMIENEHTEKNASEE